MKPLLDVEEPAIPPEAPSPEAPRPDAAGPGGDAERVVAEPVAAALRDGGLGLQLTSSGPVSATLRTVAGDLAETVASAPFEDETLAVLPGGAARLLLAGAETDGAATVTGWTASGRRVLRTRVEVTPERGTALRLPASVRLVSVDPDGTPLRGSVVVEGSGATVLPLTEQVANEIGAAKVTPDPSIAKVSLVGAGMKTNPGVAATVFETLAANDINIEMISTSAIRISVVVAGDQCDRAVAVLHSAFGLDTE